MQIIIAGIKGQIGSYLADRLSKNWDVVGFDMQPSDYDQVDALDEDAVRSFFERHQESSAVVNCLGNSDTADSLSFTSILDISKDNFTSLLNSNLVTAFIVMREYLRFFDSDQGNIINIASLYSTVSPNPNIYENSIKHPGYVASKFGLVGLTKYVAVLAAAKNIKVNCISPGAVLETRGVSGNFLKNYSNLVPMKNGVGMDDIYDVVKMLCVNRNITGQNIVIDGGYGLW